MLALIGLRLLKELYVELVFELELNQPLLVRYFRRPANVQVMCFARQRRHHDAIDLLVIAEGCLGFPQKVLFFNQEPGFFVELHF